MGFNVLDPVDSMTGGRITPRRYLHDAMTGGVDEAAILAPSQRGLSRYGGASPFEGRDILPQDYMDYLTALAGGQAMGQGQLMAQQAVQSGANNAMSMGASAQGLGAGAGATARAGRNQAIQIGAQGQNSIAAAGMQDQNMARQALLGQLQQQQQMNDTGQLQKEQMYLQMLAAQHVAQQGIQQQQAAQDAQAMGTATSMIGAAFCDENLKTNVEPANDLVEETLEQLKPYVFDYKDPAKHGEGKHVGVMAQQMPDYVVMRTEDGLALDLKKLLMFTVAALAHEHGKRKELESRLSVLESAHV